MISCNQTTKTESNSKTTDSTKVSANLKLQIYYFHVTNRCATCNSIETNVKSVLESNFKKELESGVIAFQSLNIDEKENWELAEKYQTANASLFLTSVIKGKEKNLDLTTQAFTLSKNQPDEFKKMVMDSINMLIN
jgi:hypothetical protein